MMISLLDGQTRKWLGVLGVIELIVAMVLAGRLGGMVGAVIVAVSQIVVVAAIALIRPGHSYTLEDSQAEAEETAQNTSFSNWLNMRRGREQFSGEQTG
jgi:hypothetical protein